MVKPMAVHPEQGQVLKLDLDPTLGHERKDYHPALVVSHAFQSPHRLLLGRSSGYPEEGLAQRDSFAGGLVGSWHAVAF